VAMFLTKEAVRLGLPGHAEGIACDGCPPLPRLFEQYAAGGGELLVCPICFNARKLDETNLVPTPVSPAPPRSGNGSTREQQSSVTKACSTPSTREEPISPRSGRAGRLHRPPSSRCCGDGRENGISGVCSLPARRPRSRPDRAGHQRVAADASRAGHVRALRRASCATERRRSPVRARIAGYPGAIWQRRVLGAAAVQTRRSSHG
jgi:hypothetical protein